jgi:hypothetical protein
MKEFSRFMKPKTPLQWKKKKLETGTYRELDKSTSRITPDFIGISIISRLHFYPTIGFLFDGFPTTAVRENLYPLSVS